MKSFSRLYEPYIFTVLFIQKSFWLYTGTGSFVKFILLIPSGKPQVNWFVSTETRHKTAISFEWYSINISFLGLYMILFKVIVNLVLVFPGNISCLCQSVQGGLWLKA